MHSIKPILAITLKLFLTGHCCLGLKGIMEQGRSRQHAAQNETLQGVYIIIIVILMLASLIVTALKRAHTKVAYHYDQAQRQ